MTNGISLLIAFLACLWWALWSGSDLAVVILAVLFIAVYSYFIQQSFRWEKKDMKKKIDMNLMETEYHAGYDRGYTGGFARDFGASENRAYLHAHYHGWLDGTNQRNIDAQEVAEQEKAAAIEHEVMIQEIANRVLAAISTKDD